VTKLFGYRQKKPEINKLLPLLERWFSSERGANMRAYQQSMLAEVLSDCFGYYLLQLSVDPSTKLFDGCRVQQKFRCHPMGQVAGALSEFDQLPFASESLDVVLLHHVHEVVTSPHQLLREIERVVIPSGRVVVLGFNPWSQLGVYSHIGRWLPDTIWHNQLISAQRMTDWLSLLGFETQLCQYGDHCLPAMDSDKYPSVTTFLKSWPFGNFYLISAIKQVAAMTPLKPSWKQAAASGFSGLSPAKPRVGTQRDTSQRFSLNQQQPTNNEDKS